ncbi:MAG: hypothetical protein IPH39_06110 [Sulfuritalea sp.]|nr:hypothetical protein [Sulfuritalea sp.]
MTDVAIAQDGIPEAITTDLALLGTIEEIAKLPAEQQPAYITAALTESRKWLHLATESTNPRPFAEIKAWAASIAEYARQKGLASEIVADGQEMLRRAERAVGQAVRNGQEAGEIRTRSDGPAVRDQVCDANKIGVGEFFGHKNEMTEIYSMTDGVTEGHFASALTKARAEGNLSRANVVRKVKQQSPQTRDARADLIADLAAKGNASTQMVRHIGISEQSIRQIARDYGIDIPADRLLAGSRRADSIRIAREAVISLEGLAATVDLVTNLDELDPREAQQWTASLDQSIRALNRLNRKIKEAVQ